MNWLRNLIAEIRCRRAVRRRLNELERVFGDRESVERWYPPVKRYIGKGW